MNKRKWYKSLLVPALIFTLLVKPASAFAAESAGTAPAESRAADTVILDEVLDYLSSYNIEGVDREAFLENAIRGMVYTLDDPYSDYYNPEEYQELLNMLGLDYVGLGIQMQYTDKELYVVKVAPGSSADQAGIKPGDVISAINGKPVTSYEDAERLTGEKGDALLLLVKRAGKPVTLRITISPFEFPPVESAMFPSKVGYIALNGFTEDADEQFAAALTQLQQTGMASLVLDLRDNLGGYMDTAVNIAQHFIDNGTMMYIEDNTGKAEAVTITDGSKLNIPVVVLTNENTASASEALTGALRDNGLATIVGTQTYGKGRIQNLIPLSNGGDLKLTTMKFMTPNKEDFNHIGLKPNVEVKNSTAQLITALKLAGLQAVKLTGDNHVLNVNGYAIAGNMGLMINNNQVYVSARVLNALVDGSISWQPKTKKVVIQAANGKLAGFTLTSGAAVAVNGENYLKLTEFQSKFPQVKSSYVNKQLSLWING